MPQQTRAPLAAATLAAFLMAALCTAVPAFAQGGSQAGGQGSVQASAPGDAAAFVQRFDRSGKGQLDLKGALNAAIVKFGRLDVERRGRLTEQQLGGLLTPEEFRIANPDGDTTIGAEEWFDLVRRRFHAANPDNDGSLTADEFKSPAGQALLRLLQ